MNDFQLFIEYKSKTKKSVADFLSSIGQSNVYKYTLSHIGQLIASYEKEVKTSVRKSTWFDDKIEEFNIYGNRKSNGLYSLRGFIKKGFRSNKYEKKVTEGDKFKYICINEDGIYVIFDNYSLDEVKQILINIKKNIGI